MDNPQHYACTECKGRGEAGAVCNKDDCSMKGQAMAQCDCGDENHGASQENPQQDAEPKAE